MSTYSSIYLSFFANPNPRQAAEVNIAKERAAGHEDVIRQRDAALKNNLQQRAQINHLVQQQAIADRAVQDAIAQKHATIRQVSSSALLTCVALRNFALKTEDRK